MNCIKDFLLFYMIIQVASSHEATSEQNKLILQAKKSLTKLLQQNFYDIDVPPNYPNWTHVGVTIWPEGIQSLHDREETITANIWMQLTWYDPRISWQNSSSSNSSHCPTPYLLFDRPEIWTPYLKVREMTYRVPKPTLKHVVVVARCDGHVRMAAFFVDPMHCFMRTRYFPFDKQACPLTFLSMRHTLLEHRMRYSTQEQFEEIYDEENFDTGDWEMFIDVSTLNKTFNRVESDISETYGISELKYTLRVERKSFQNVLDWIVPPILLTTSGIIAMYLGCNVQERYTFGGSVVVTLTVMLESFREKMPIAIDGYPILASLYLGLLGINILATLFCALPGYLHSLGRRWTTKYSEATSSHASTVTVTDERLSGSSPVNPENAKIDSKEKLNAALVSAAKLAFANNHKKRGSIKKIRTWKAATGQALRRWTDGMVIDMIIMTVFLTVEACIVAFAVYKWQFVAIDFRQIEKESKTKRNVDIETTNDLF